MRAALVHTDDPEYLGMGYADAWTRALAERGLVASADELVTAAIWAAHGISQPRAWDLDAVDDRRPVARGTPMVLKPAYCDGARHIELVRSIDEARDVETAWREDEARGGERRGAAVLQEWIEEPACARLFATDPEQGRFVAAAALERVGGPAALAA